MKLSEAIRLGAMLKPQAFDALTDGTGTCAVGAAYDAVGLPMNEDIEQWPREWNWVFGLSSCPVCKGSFAVLDGVILAHLNDRHRWTREQIADWLATVEPDEAVADPDPVPETVEA